MSFRVSRSRYGQHNLTWVSPSRSPHRPGQLPDLHARWNGSWWVRDDAVTASHCHYGLPNRWPRPSEQTGVGATAAEGRELSGELRREAINIDLQSTRRTLPYISSVCMIGLDRPNKWSETGERTVALPSFPALPLVPYWLIISPRGRLHRGVDKQPSPASELRSISLLPSST